MLLRTFLEVQILWPPCPNRRPTLIIDLPLVGNPNLELRSLIFYRLECGATPRSSIPSDIKKQSSPQIQDNTEHSRLKSSPKISHQIVTTFNHSYDMADTPISATQAPLDPREQPILDELLLLRTDLTLLKQDRTTYVKSSVVLPLYNRVVDQVSKLNEIRSNHPQEQNRGECVSML